MMLAALTWFAFGYAALKLVGMSLARSPGFGRTAISFPQRLRAGEPALLIIAFSVFVPLALLIASSAARSMRGTFDESTTCYAQIVALRHVPAVRHAADDSTVYDRVENFKFFAYATGQELRIKPPDVTAILSQRTASTAARYARDRSGKLQRQMDREIAQALHCLGKSK